MTRPGRTIVARTIAYWTRTPSGAKPDWAESARWFATMARRQPRRWSRAVIDRCLPRPQGER